MRLICVAPATIAQIPVAPYQRSVEVIGCQAGPFSAFDATSSPHVHATTSCPASAVVRGHLLRLRPSCRRPRPASASSVTRPPVPMNLIDAGLPRSSPGCPEVLPYVSKT